jgi:hypothetical protein
MKIQIIELLAAATIDRYRDLAQFTSVNRIDSRVLES